METKHEYEPPVRSFEELILSNPKAESILAHAMGVDLEVGYAMPVVR